MPTDRPGQVPFILEAVLRYQVHEFALREGGRDGTLCVAVREAGRLTDPGPAIMLRLGNRQAQPQSACTGDETLIIGPVEWSRDDEVRVRGGFLKATEGETPLAYRVVREEGRWVCVGPIVSWDPL